MPPNVVKTKRDEQLWEKAKEQAQKQDQGENWAYVVGIYKKMNPDRFKTASGLADELIGIAARHPRHAKRIASIMMEAAGWVPGELRDTMTWAPGHLERTDPTFGDVGSQVPPARDSFGDELDEDR